MKAAERFVTCLENEGFEIVFAVPGEENVDVMDTLLGSWIKLITARHETRRRLGMASRRIQDLY
jgi:acetolactate synthase-1/2/3 large subunit